MVLARPISFIIESVVYFQVFSLTTHSSLLTTGFKELLEGIISSKPSTSRVSHPTGQAVSHAVPSQPQPGPCSRKATPAKISTATGTWGVLAVTMENALVESKTAQAKLIPLSWCPLRAADDPEQRFLGSVVFTSVWLHIIHHRCTLSSCSLFSFFSGEGDQGSCTYVLVLLHTYFSCAISQLLSCRQELPQCTRSPPFTAVQTQWCTE